MWLIVCISNTVLLLSFFRFNPITCEMASVEHPEAEGPVFELHVSESDEASEKSMQQKSYEEEFRPFRKGFFLYFSYGSNLLRERLLLKNPSATFLTIAKLEDYKLVFGQQRAWKSTAWKGGVATIEHSPGDHVWGVVWKLNRRHLQKLDLQLGVHLRIYLRFETAVITPHGEGLPVYTYYLDRCIPLKPSPQYIEVITMGAKNEGIPWDYIIFLSEVVHNNYQGNVRVYEETKLLIKDIEDSRKKKKRCIIT